MTIGRRTRWTRALHPERSLPTETDDSVDVTAPSTINRYRVAHFSHLVVLILTVATFHDRFSTVRVYVAPENLNVKMTIGNAKTNAGNSDERQENKNVSHDMRRGLNAMYVKLVSSDNQVFIIKREEAMVSGTIRKILTGPGNSVGRLINVIHFPLIRADILKIVCEYFKCYKKYGNSSAANSIFLVSSEVSFEVLIAAHFLDC